MAVASRAAELRCDGSTMLLSQLQDPARGVGGFDRHADDTAQEEAQPFLPITAIAHRLQVLVVGPPMLLERSARDTAPACAARRAPSAEK